MNGIIEHLEDFKRENLAHAIDMAEIIVAQFGEKLPCLRDIDRDGDDFAEGVFNLVYDIRSKYKPFNDLRTDMSTCFCNLDKIEIAMVAIKSNRDAMFFEFAIEHLCYKRREMGG